MPFFVENDLCSTCTDKLLAAATLHFLYHNDRLLIEVYQLQFPVILSLAGYMVYKLKPLYPN